MPAETSNTSKVLTRSAYSTIIFQRYAGFIGIGRFHEYKLIFPNFVENALRGISADKLIPICLAYHVIPCGDDGFHIQVTRKECHNAVGDDLAILDQDTAKVSDHGRVISDFETRADRDLVASSRDDLVYVSTRITVKGRMTH